MIRCTDLSNSFPLHVLIHVLFYCAPRVAGLLQSFFFFFWCYKRSMYLRYVNVLGPALVLNVTPECLCSVHRLAIRHRIVLEIVSRNINSNSSFPWPTLSIVIWLKHGIPTKLPLEKVLPNDEFQSVISLVNAPNSNLIETWGEMILVWKVWYGLRRYRLNKEIWSSFLVLPASLILFLLPKTLASSHNLFSFSFAFCDPNNAT